MATLKFSTGETAIIGPPAIIGRNPSAKAADIAGAQLIVVSDRSRTVSRMHADVAWVGGKLTVSDRGAGNGPRARQALTRSRDGAGRPRPRVALRLGARTAR